MIDRDRLSQLLSKLDPMAKTPEIEVSDRRDIIWTSISNQMSSPTPVLRTHLPRSRGVSVLTGALAAVTIIVTVLFGSAPTNAVAAVLRSATRADAKSANLPMLQAGQFYHQSSLVSMTCLVGSPAIGDHEAPLTYISNGTMQSWTSQSLVGTVSVSASTLNHGGSHFASRSDRSRWIHQGRPNIPCALSGDVNHVSNNPANTSSGSLGGSTVTVTAYADFGFLLAATPTSTQVTLSSKMNNLPTSVATIADMLANGQISEDGTISSTPQICPVDSNATTTGCDSAQQLLIAEQLLQIPDASAKLGSVLYQVIAQMPGATMAGHFTDEFGRTGSAVVVSTSATTQFEVVLNTRTGALLSCSALESKTGSVGTFTRIAEISYGPVTVVDGHHHMRNHRVGSSTKTRAFEVRVVGSSKKVRSAR